MEELEEDVPICITAKEFIRKPTMVVDKRLLLVPEVMEVPGEEVKKLLTMTLCKK